MGDPGLLLGSQRAPLQQGVEVHRRPTPTRSLTTAAATFLAALKRRLVHLLQPGLVHGLTVVGHAVGEEHAAAAVLVRAVRRAAEVLVTHMSDVFATLITNLPAARARHFVATFGFVKPLLALRIGTFTNARLTHGLLHIHAKAGDRFLLDFAAAQGDVRLLLAEPTRLLRAGGASKHAPGVAAELCLIATGVALQQTLDVGRLDGLLRHCVLVLAVHQRRKRGRHEPLQVSAARQATICW